MPTWLFATLFYQAPARLGLDAYTANLRFSLLVLVFIGTCLVPGLLIFYLYRTGFLTDLAMPRRTDRRLPYWLTGGVYALVTYLFMFRLSLVSDTSPAVSILLGSITVSILLVGVINMTWKISAHAVGVGGVLGAVAFLFLKHGDTDLFVPFVGLLALSGLVGTARLQLNAHTLSQVGAGLLLGTLVSGLTVIWLV